MKYLKNVFAAMMCAAMVIGCFAGNNTVSVSAADDATVAVLGAQLEAAEKAYIQAQSELETRKITVAEKQAALNALNQKTPALEAAYAEATEALNQLNAKRKEVTAQIQTTREALIGLLQENEIDPYGSVINIGTIGQTDEDPTVGIMEIDAKIAELSALEKQSAALMAQLPKVNFAQMTADDALYYHQEEVWTAQEALTTANEAYETQKTKVESLKATYETAKQEYEAAIADTPSSSNLPFDDVSEDAWYYDVVSDVFQKGLMTGMNPTTFAPDLTLNRAFLAAVLYRRAGSPAVEYSDVFPDVPADEWYTNCVLWARKAGVILGYNEGTFGPTDSLKREQLCTILWRCAEYMDGVDNSARASLDGYRDSWQITDFAVEAIQWCEAMGILNYRDGRIAAWEDATRADCAWMISKYLEVTRQEK